MGAITLFTKQREGTFIRVRETLKEENVYSE